MRAVAAVIALTLFAPAAALAVTPRASFNDIEDEVMCVSCRVPLNIAESPQASQERAEIHRLIDLGLTKKQILVRLSSSAEYGPGILADPPTHGFNITTWLVPAGVVAALLGALAVLIPRWRSDGTAPSEDIMPALSAADARRLDEDLARFDV